MGDCSETKRIPIGSVDPITNPYMVLTIIIFYIFSILEVKNIITISQQIPIINDYFRPKESAANPENIAPKNPPKKYVDTNVSN